MAQEEVKASQEETVTAEQQEIAEKGAEYQWQVARLQDLKQEACHPLLSGQAHE